MPIMCIFRVPDATPADYDEVRSRVRWEESPPKGGIAHFLTFTAAGAVEYDVWESRAAFERFHELRMRPVLDELGIDMGKPEIIELDGVAIAENVAAHQVPRQAPRTAAARVIHETDALA